MFQKHYYGGKVVVIEEAGQGDGFTQAERDHAYRVKYKNGRKRLISLNVVLHGPCNPNKLATLARKVYKQVTSMYPDFQPSRQENGDAVVCQKNKSTLEVIFNGEVPRFAEMERLKLKLT